MRRAELEPQYHVVDQEKWLNMRVPAGNEKRFESIVSFEKIIFSSQFPQSDQTRSRLIEQLVIFLVQKIQERLNAAITDFSVIFGMNANLHLVGYRNFQISLLTQRELKTENDKEEIINLLKISINEFHGGRELRLNEAILEASVEKSLICSVKKIIVAAHPCSILTVRNACRAIERMDCEYRIGMEPFSPSMMSNETTVIHVEKRCPNSTNMNSNDAISVSSYTFPEVPQRESITALPIFMPTPKTQQSKGIIPSQKTDALSL